ncbi:carbamoyltransferase HypF [Candidatus Bipolaricaulota bacterium]|nr:carbamoyltransferase HypF [Candidatus Bipolaricaulota bacterium]
MAAEGRRLLVSGVVQGVGFRPFIYRIAQQRGLAGTVRNLGDAGVEILVEGSADAIQSFLQALADETPPLARIDEIKQFSIVPTGACAFVILPSTEEGAGAGQLPPDVAICDACVSEVLGPSRFQGYWATSCTDCGPRFTVIEALPYDRPRTSMSEFPMCATCESEYTNPLERRYHAQTTACDACGPVLQLDGDADDAIARCVRALDNGKIVAIKGIGGTHIACDASNERAIRILRDRLGRPHQPFAVMATESMLDSFVDASAEERDMMRRRHRPIVVLRKKAMTSLPGAAPGLHTVGVMLPYSGLHHMLFESLDAPLAMTSANRPGQPMLIENQEIVAHLEGIADHFLLHDRRIVARCDDSVQRYVAGKCVFLRRSRGLVPQGLERNLGGESILALGPESDLTFALYDRGRVTLSQHIGNVDDLDTLAYLQEAVGHLQRMTKVRMPGMIVCDEHPRFLTSQWAKELATTTGARVIRTQHHAAHLASVMIEHELQHCVGIVLDGYGYGTDGTAWGGEVFAVKDQYMLRAGSLMPVGLPGGDMAARVPLRMAAALLVAASGKADAVVGQLVERGMGETEAKVLMQQLDSGINVPLTTSAGRFLDAVSAWLGVCSKRTYEGEPAMRLEATASMGQAHPMRSRCFEAGGILRLDTADLFAQLVQMSTSFSVEDVAATAQKALAEGIASLALRVAQEQGISSIALSGGVAYNDSISSRIRQCCEEGGFDFFTNTLVPCGDGGVCLGQAAMAGLAMVMGHEPLRLSPHSG